MYVFREFECSRAGKLIVTIAPTGMIPTKKDTPYVPITPEEIAATALQEDVNAIGLSSLSGAHLRLFPAVIEALKKAEAGDIPVLGGGVIPDDDLSILKGAGIKEIFTPGTSMEDIVDAFKKACEEYHREQSRY